MIKNTYKLKVGLVTSITLILRFIRETQQKTFYYIIYYIYYSTIIHTLYYIAYSKLHVTTTSLLYTYYILEQLGKDYSNLVEITTLEKF